MTASVLYEKQDKVAVLTLNRPEVNNAQDPELLRRLDEAWGQANDDQDVHVILLQANGRNFSAGHDMNPDKAWNKSFNTTRDGIVPHYLWEHGHYFEYSKRWRNLPKPSIACVQGACVAAGLMLVWPCDLIVASENAWFGDPTIVMGIAGVEYHGHTWELGPRKAKQLLFTADRITAREAHQLGMVNEVVADAELRQYAMSLASRIAEKSLFALMMGKRAVNQAMDSMGQPAALQAGFDLHEMQHTQCLAISQGKFPVLTSNVNDMKRANKRETKAG